MECTCLNVYTLQLFNFKILWNYLIIIYFLNLSPFYQSTVYCKIPSSIFSFFYGIFNCISVDMSFWGTVFSPSSLPVHSSILTRTEHFWHVTCACTELSVPFLDPPLSLIFKKWKKKKVKHLFQLIPINHTFLPCNLLWEIYCLLCFLSPREACDLGLKYFVPHSMK